MNRFQITKAINKIKGKQISLNDQINKGQISLEKYENEWARLQVRLWPLQAQALVLGNKEFYNYKKDSITQKEAWLLNKKYPSGRPINTKEVNKARKTLEKRLAGRKR